MIRGAARRLVTSLITVALFGTGMVVTAVPASAASRDGTCDSGEVCLFFNSNQGGSVSDLTGSISDYGADQPTCYEFKSTGLGKGQCVKNHTASVWNRTGKTVRVYENSGYDGRTQDFAPGARGNLNAALKNNNAGHQLRSTPVDQCTTDGTNTALPTSILVYRVKLGRVDRVGFKTYVKNVLPNEWIPSWRSASLDAGAMAVKSFGWYWALHSTRKTPNGHCYDVRDDTGSQVYKPSSATASTTAAVERTWNTRMTRAGKIFEAHYCATDTACPGWRTGDWLSQYGSQSKATSGQSFKQILRFYYAGIALT